MATVLNGSIELYYETFGNPSDPTIICIPGMGSQLLIYDEGFCLALVDRGFHTIRMDNRDSGLSSATVESDEYTLDDMADDVLAVLDDAEVEDAIVFGISLGGMVSQAFAIKYPARTRALVSAMSATGEPDIGFGSAEVIEALLLPDEATAEAQIEADLRVRKLWSNPDWYDEEPLRAYFIACSERSRVVGGGLRQFAAVSRSADRVAALRALDVPTLVIHGESDTLITAEAGRRTAELIPGATYLEIEEMSHDFVYQVWPAFVEAMTSLAARTFS
ncbi:MAG: alpha/beta fold hydrolase [Acidimicrobiaceae bacterium]|nr:alpha/beta fold hydrolase [Acidimicrobiaceae bacterium]